MKEIIIKPRHIKRELYIALAAFAIAFVLNIYAILKYKTHWSELLSQIGYVLALTVVIYLLALVVRLVVFGIGKLLKK